MTLRVPHTFVLLFALIAASAALTRVIPAGEYRRVVREGRQLVEQGSYRRVEGRAAGPAEVFLAYPRGLAQVAPIVFYIFLIGGTFGVIHAAGAVEAGIAAVLRACGGRGELVLPALTILFSLGGATIGLAEETLLFLPALAALSRRLGYDEITGGAVALVGAGAGFSGGFLNPFTVGVAQGIVGLPLFSGFGYRLFVWAVLTAITVAYLNAYARRVRRLQPADAAVPGAASHRAETPQTRSLAVLAVLSLFLAAAALGALRWGWGILELSGLFVALAVAAGLVGGLGPDATAERFLEGAAAIAPGALVVGLARGILVIFDEARVTDTILHGLADLVSGLPSWAAVGGIFSVQVTLSFLVPSGSGQAALSLPILAPLGDLVGVSRQTSVLAYQFGDGFSNVLTPTQGYFMAGLALIGVSWERWFRFIWRLQLLWLGAGLILLWIAHAAGWE